MYIVLPYPLYFLLQQFPVAFEKNPCETLHLTLLPVTSIGKKQKSPLPRVGPSVFGGVDIDAPSKIIIYSIQLERLSISQSPFLDTLLVN